MNIVTPCAFWRRDGSCSRGFRFPSDCSRWHESGCYEPLLHARDIDRKLWRRAIETAILYGGSNDH